MQKLCDEQDRDLTPSLLDSCRDFIAFLEPKYKEDKLKLPPVPCILVFDEAQELTQSSPKSGDPEGRSYFHHLGSVLKQLLPCNVFSVFLSTNSNLRSLAPPVRLHPSLRGLPEPEQSRLYPPITELPFDVFAKDLHDTLSTAGKSTLSAMCSLDVMVNFGRTM